MSLVDRKNLIAPTMLSYLMKERKDRDLIIIQSLIRTLIAKRRMEETSFN